MYDYSDLCVLFADKFTGKERDSESGLDYFGARYDSSQYGRFMTPDWAARPVSVPYAQFGDPQTLNLYSYARNNPIAKADRDGHCIWDLCIVEGIGVVEVVATAVTAYGLYKAGQGFFGNMNKATQNLNDSYRNEEKAVAEGTKVGTNANGDAAKAENLDRQSEKNYASAARDTMGAVKNAAQLPGTTTGGDLPTSVTDIVVGAASGVVTGPMIDSTGHSHSSSQTENPKAHPAPPPPPPPPQDHDRDTNDL